MKNKKKTTKTMVMMMAASPIGSGEMGGRWRSEHGLLMRAVRRKARVIRTGLGLSGRTVRELGVLGPNSTRPRGRDPTSNDHRPARGVLAHG